MSLSPFPMLSQFPLNFLILSPFPLDFLILSPFSRNQDARMQQVVQPWLFVCEYVKTIHEIENSWYWFNKLHFTCEWQSRSDTGQYSQFSRCLIHSNRDVEFVTNGICIKYVLAWVKLWRINAKNNNSGKFAEIKITVVSFYLGI